MINLPRALFTKVVVACLFVGVVCILIESAFGLLAFREVGNTDSATLLRVGDFVRDGHIYPDTIHHPPYYVTIYGPLTYAILSIPYRLAQSFTVDPAVALQLTILAAFFTCVVLLFLITRQFSNSLQSAWVAALFALSSQPMAAWTTQIRSDFLALAFSLFAFYLFLRLRDRPTLFLTAIPAGLALLIKQTLVAAPLAIVGWLIFRRRYKEAAYWAASTAFVVVGGYWLISRHEPLMAQHLASLRNPVFEYAGAVRIVITALSQPVTPFAIVGAFLIFWKCSADSWLLPFYWIAAWLIAFVTIPQAGGDINYFWESLWVSSVLAGLAITELRQKLANWPLAYGALTVLLALMWFFPSIHADLAFLKHEYQRSGSFRSDQRSFKEFASLIKGRRILSTYSDLALLSANPQVPDPGLNTVLESGHHWSYQPITEQVDRQMFDIVILWPGWQIGWRSLPLWDHATTQALSQQYHFACVFQDMEVWLPNAGDSTLLPRLSAIGCQPPQHPFLIGLSPRSPRPAAALQ